MRLGLLLQTHNRQGFPDPLLDLRPIHPHPLQAERDFFVRGTEFNDVPTRHEDLAVRGLQQAVEVLEEGALTCAVLPDERDELSFSYREV